MDKESRKFLEDILQAIASIEKHLGNKHDFNFFHQNFTVRRAIQFEILVIGEAVTRLVKLEAQVTITDSKKIISMRNKIVHEYDIVDETQIWAVVVKHLPILKLEVGKILADDQLA